MSSHSPKEPSRRWPPHSGQSRRGEGGTQDPALQFPREGQKERGIKRAALALLTLGHGWRSFRAPAGDPTWAGVPGPLEQP